MANVLLSIRSEEADAIRGFQRLVDAQVKVEKGMKRNVQEGKRFSKGITGIGKAAKGLLPVLGVGGALSAGLAGGLKILGDYDRLLNTINQRTTALRGTMAAFQLVQPGGAGARNQMIAARLGAQFGVSPAQALTTVQAFQAQVGLASGLRAARAVFQAQELGVGPAEARQIGLTVFARQKAGEDISPREAIAVGVQAGVASNFTPEQIARTFRAIPEVETRDAIPFAFAAAVPLAAQFGPEVFQTRLRAAGAELGRVPTGRRGQIFRKAGAGADLVERLSALREAGIDTKEDLAGVGITGIEATAAVQTLIRDLPSILDRAATFREKAREPEFLARRIKFVEEQDAILRLANERARLQAQRQVEETFGAVGVEAGVTGKTQERIAAAVLGVPFLQSYFGEKPGAFRRGVGKTIFPTIGRQEEETRIGALLQRRETGVITPEEESRLEAALGGEIARETGAGRFGAAQAATVRARGIEQGLSTGERIDALIAALERNTEATEASFSGAVAPRPDKD